MSLAFREVMTKEPFCYDADLLNSVIELSKFMAFHKPVVKVIKPLYHPVYLTHFVKNLKMSDTNLYLQVNCDETFQL